MKKSAVLVGFYGNGAQTSSVSICELMRGNIFSRHVLQPPKYIKLGTEPFIFNN